MYDGRSSQSKTSGPMAEAALANIAGIAAGACLVSALHSGQDVDQHQNHKTMT